MQAPPGANPGAPPGNYPGYNNYNQPGFPPSQYANSANVTYAHGGGLQTTKQAPPATSGTMPTRQPPISSMNGYNAQSNMLNQYNQSGYGVQQPGPPPPGPPMTGPQPPRNQLSGPPIAGPQQRHMMPPNGPSGEAASPTQQQRPPMPPGPMSNAYSQLQPPPLGQGPGQQQPPVSQMQSMSLSGPPLPPSSSAPQPPYQQQRSSMMGPPQAGGQATMPPQPQQPGMMPPQPQQPGMMPPQPQQPGMMPPPPRPGMVPAQQQQMVPPQQPGMLPQQSMMPPQSGMQPHQPGMPPPPGTGMMPPTSQNQFQQHGMQGRSYPNQPQQPPARRLDPDKMPSPIQVIEADKEHHQFKTFDTGGRGNLPPLVTTKFQVQDSGNASPRFIRCSTYNLPANAEMVKTCQLPMSICVKPLARLPDNEPPPCLVEHTDGPIRCKRCKCYMCPQFGFVDGGRRFQCHMCHCITDTPHHYFNHIDHMNQRVDKQTRAELCRGSYEFVATKDYCRNDKEPLPPAFIFAIDVSYNAVRSGMVGLLCENLRSLIDTLPREYGMEKSAIKVGFLTYSNVIHFYNLNKSLAQPQMMVVSDVNDIFVPLQDGFLVDIDESRHVIESLLERIPEMFRDTRETELVFAPVIQAAVQSLKSCERAGKLFMFHSGLPSAEAPGKLKMRDDRKLIGTDKERTLFTPVGNVYEKLAAQCVGAACCVDLFLFPNQYADVATLAQVPEKTGGQVYKYNFFNSEIDGQRFIDDLAYDLQRDIVFDAIMRVRTSTGIRPVDFLGSLHMSNTTDVELAAIDCDKAITVELKHDDKIAEDQGAHIQVALLYTSVSGKRRLRVHNLSLSVSNNYADLFRNCETDMIMNHVAKKAIRNGLQLPTQKIREELITQFCSALAVYRKHVASPTSPGQLILPECMKLVPAYVNCLLKCDAISSSHDVSTDDRSYLRHLIMSRDVGETQALFYPALIPVTNGEVQPDGLPVAVRCTEDRLIDSNAFLLENTVNIFLWIGQNVSPEWIKNVFGVDSIGEIEVNVGGLQVFDNDDSRHIHQLMSVMQQSRSQQMKMTIVRQHDKLEPFFKHFLVEDRGSGGAASYVDFLCHMHKEIRQLLS